jgi:hypothetical protein
VVGEPVSRRRFPARHHPARRPAPAVRRAS